jgi:uncharacterized protein (UPF0335 family)
MPEVGGIAGDHLKSFVERIERLEEEKKALGGDIKEVYAEAKGTGFDPKIMRMLIKERRMDKDALDEQEMLLDVYRRALGMLADLPLGESALRRTKALRGEVEKFVNSVPDGTSTSITVNGKGVKITNKGGKKTVEPVGAKA